MTLPKGSLTAVLLLTLGFASQALADGPQEPNETPATAYGPVVSTRLIGALETPQDLDWYVLYPKAARQVGVVLRLTNACPKQYGSLWMQLLDADGSSDHVDEAKVGFDASAPDGTRTADNFVFTSLRGHRYFLRVSQSSCLDGAYDIAISQPDALTGTLEPTAECVKASDEASAARRTATRLRVALRRAHGVRRKRLKTRYALQRQAVVVAESDRTDMCTRKAIRTTYPWG